MQSLFYLTAGRLGKNENLEVYVVGGFVRDLLMEQPLNDIDLMVVGDGIRFAKKLAKSLDKKRLFLSQNLGLLLFQIKK